MASYICITVIVGSCQIGQRLHYYLPETLAMKTSYSANTLRISQFVTKTITKPDMDSVIATSYEQNVVQYIQSSNNEGLMNAKKPPKSQNLFRNDNKDTMPAGLPDIARITAWTCDFLHNPAS